MGRQGSWPAGRVAAGAALLSLLAACGASPRSGSAPAAAPAAAGARQALYEARYADDGRGRRLLTQPPQAAAAAPHGRAAHEDPAVSETSYPQTIVEHAPLGPARIVVLRAAAPEALSRVLAARGVEG